MHEQTCPNGECAPWDGCCPGRKLCVSNCIPDDACCHADPFPLCGPCDKVVCEDGQYACQPRSDLKQCPDGSCVAPDACCPGDEPACGFCEVLACEQGQSLCKELRHECEPGGEWKPERCRCEYCEETCDPVTKMCHSNCPEGHACVEGKCHKVCTNPSKPQLCCKENRPGSVDCACAPANAICHPCGWVGGACWCTPGQTCCDPEEVRSGKCPQECLEAEICRD